MRVTFLCLNRLPISGISPSTGTEALSSVLASFIRPPITMIWPLLARTMLSDSCTELSAVEIVWFEATVICFSDTSLTDG